MVHDKKNHPVYFKKKRGEHLIVSSLSLAFSLSFSLTLSLTAIIIIILSSSYVHIYTTLLTKSPHVKWFSIDRVSLYIRRDDDRSCTHNAVADGIRPIHIFCFCFLGLRSCHFVIFLLLFQNVMRTYIFWCTEFGMSSFSNTLEDCFVVYRSWPDKKNAATIRNFNRRTYF